jgi:hypothetical protein
MANVSRPIFDILQDERRAFIGPPSPPQLPKLTPVHEREAVYAMMLDDLVARIAAETSANTKRK